MKIKSFFLLLFSNLLLNTCTFLNNGDSKYNLDFEIIKDNLPLNWELVNSHSDIFFSLDPIEVKSGKYSAVLESKSDTVNYGAVISFRLHESYFGKEIKLSGYIKKENINGTVFLAINNLPKNRIEDTISGSSDWKKYEVTAKLFPQISKEITITCGLMGKGKVWFDDFRLTIDGKDIRKARPYNSEIFSAKKDKEFDNGSNIVFPELTEQITEDLELLGRIWGFLKYHHPAIAEGDYNWDFELFRILPSYLNVSDNEQRDWLLLDWIKRYGRISECSDCPITSDNAFIKPDLSWIEAGNINLKLRDLLHKIYLNRNQNENHYYILLDEDIGYPFFLNENSYSEMDYPDAGFRLLALYRYWSIINYFFPYKYLTDKDWNIVLKEYVPYFIEAKDRLDYELVTTKIIGEVCDSHAFLKEGGIKINSLYGIWQAPVEVKFIENKLVVTDYYMDFSLSEPEKVLATGLKIGDIISSINGLSVNAIYNNRKKYYPASNEEFRLKLIAENILRSPKQTININYVSFGQLKQKEILLENRRKLFRNRNLKEETKSYKFLGSDIGYVTLKSIKEEDVPEIRREFFNTKGIIIDIRNYPSAPVFHSLGSYFVSDATPFVKFTLGNMNNPGEFNFFTHSMYDIPKPEETYKGKLVVIVNEETISHAEFTAMAFRAGDNTTIIGSQTAGADGNVSRIVLHGGLKTNISGIGVYYPDGSETQRIGIVPDIEVKPTIKGIIEGRDELLEKAIEIIKNDK